ncbi:MAG: ABC transporter substrate-binding protein [Burkholderiales bacterium]
MTVLSRMRTIAGVVASAACLMASQSIAQTKQVTVFIGPAPIYDSIWMADARGFFKAEGLDVQFRLFPSGTTALQTFRTGQGDLITNGELPGVAHWVNANKDYRLISVIERDAITYRITALKDIQKPQDLKGKTIATRVGSTGSWFISTYLQKNGMTDKDVTIKNLDTQVLPTALCQREIAAFFIWQPFGARALEICPDRAHYIGSAEGLINGYAVLGARPAWLATPDGKDISIKFLRAMQKGKEVAEKDFDAVAKYAQDKYSLSRQATKDQWDVSGRHIGFDETFFSDHCNLAGWMRDNNLMKGQFDFNEYIWTDGWRAIDPKLVKAAPNPC